MHILRWLFTLMATCGYSRPPSWRSPLKKFTYNLYTIFTVILIYTTAVSQILDLVLVVDNVDDFSDNFYVTLVYIVTCFKTCNLLITRRNTMMLVDILQKEPFLPMDVEETEIRTKFDKEAEKNSKTYAFAVIFCIVWTFLMTLIVEFENKKLPFRAWFPFDYSSALKFSFVYAHQAMSSLICCLSNVACDSLFSSLLVQIYCQFEILEYRLHNIRKNENDLVKQCARHHSHIYRFATMVNEKFKMIMLVQFFMSTSTICFDLYQLTQNEMDSKAVEILMYASCTLLQIYYYCWYGNEVKLKSLEVTNMIFESDWTTLTTKTKKILLMIMKRSSSPIEFTSLYIVSVNLEAFKMLLKTSYSIYNLVH